MNRKLLSLEAQAALRSNPYVETVTAQFVTFTPEFKEKAYHALVSGKRVRAIFEENGLDPEILGRSRIYGFCNKLSTYAEREERFVDLRRSRYRRVPKTPRRKKATTVENRVAYLENQVAFMEQEMEFLKKIRQADLEAQKSWASKRQRE